MRSINMDRPANMGNGLNDNLVRWYSGIGQPYSNGADWGDIAKISDGISTNSTYDVRWAKPYWTTTPHAWTPHPWFPGRYGLKLDAANAQYFEIAGLDEYTTQPATLSLWLRRQVNTGSNPDTGILNIGGLNHTHYPFSDGNLYFGLFTLGARPISGIADGGFDKTVLHHLLISAQTGTNLYKVYRNGVLLAQGTSTQQEWAVFSSSSVVGASGTAGLPQELFTGEFYDLRLFTKAMNVDEAEAEYAAGLKGYAEQFNYTSRSSFFAVTSTFTATAAVTIGGMTGGGSATYGPGTHTATGAATIGGMTCSGTASYHSYASTGAVSIAPMTSSGTALFLEYFGTGTCIIGAMTSAGAATFGPGGAKTATATITLGAMFSQGQAYRFSPNYQQMVYWGRFARGEYLNAMLSVPGDINEVPSIEFWLEGTSIIKTSALPTIDHANKTFGMPILLDDSFVDGHYCAVMGLRVTASGIDYASIALFDVVGGIGEAPIISLAEVDRSLGRAVISQDAEGLVRLGYNPRTH